MHLTAGRYRSNTTIRTPGDQALSPRLLFLQYETALGAAVHAAPVFEAVRAARPRSFIAVACAGLPRHVLRHNPFIDLVAETANPHHDLLAAARHIVGRLRPHRFDAVVTDCGNMKRRLALLGALSGAERRVGFTVAPRLYHCALHPDPDISVHANNLRLIEVLGLGTAAAEPKVFFSRAETASVEALLSEHGVAGARHLAIFITQTSGGQPSQWYAERFAAVADYLAVHHGSVALFVGSASEASAIDGIRALMRNRSVSLAGRTDIPTLAALMCRCDLAVSLDTGPMHIARAVGIPMVVIAPAWQPAHEWLPPPACDRIVLRRDDIHCAGCLKFVCATRECMDEIGVEAVIEAVERVIRHSPPSPTGRQQRAEARLVDRR